MIKKSKIKNQKSKLQFKIQNFGFCIVILIFAFCILNFTGCVVRTYPVTKERVDQDLTAGNKGYLQGQAPEGVQEKARKTSRTTQVVEVELHPPIRFEKMPKPKPAEETKDKELWGNQGYITKSYTAEPLTATAGPLTIMAAGPAIKKYTVQKGDTLQKIAKKFYGTTKKWTKIYEANKDVLRGPNKIYPRQVLNIPIEPLKETPENLK